MGKESYFTAKYLVSLPERDAGVMASVVRVHPSRVDAHKRSKGKIFRREPVILHNRATGLQTIRFALGAGGLNLRSPNAIGIDHDTADALGICSGAKSKEVEVIVSPASYFRVVFYFIKHPDWGYRVATHLGLGGLVFGIVGASLAILSFF